MLKLKRNIIKIIESGDFKELTAALNIRIEERIEDLVWEYYTQVLQKKKTTR